MNRWHYSLVSVLATGLLLVVAKVVIPNWTLPGQSHGVISNDLLEWTVKCSSQKSDPKNKYHCTNALPNRSGEWVSDGQTNGAFIEVQFPKEVELRSIRLYDRGDALQSIQDGHLDFFDGTRYPAIDRNGANKGIAVVATQGFPNAVIVLPESKRTLGFRFVIDAVSDTTTEVGLAEIAPQFVVPIDARSRPRRLVGTLGVAYHDVEGVLPLGPALGPKADGQIQIQAQEQPTPSGAVSGSGIRLQVEASKTAPGMQVFSARARHTQWMQYRLTAKGGDILIYSIPIALAYESQSGKSDVTSPVKVVRLYADTDAGMRHKIILGPDNGVPVDSRGNAVVDFPDQPLRIPKNQSIYINIGADLNAIGADLLLSAVGFARGSGVNSDLSLKEDSYPGWYGIDVRDALTGISIPPSTINDTGSAGGNVVRSTTHAIIPAVLRVEEVDQQTTSFSGGRIDETVLRFRLQSESLDTRIKTIEFIGFGSCNDGMKKPGRARLIEVDGASMKEIAVWENAVPGNLLYSTYRHTPLRISSGQSKEFELRMDTQCASADTLQFHIGGSQSFVDARETRSGIQWFLPFMSAAMAVDLSTIPGLPLHGPILSPGAAQRVADLSNITLSPDTTLACEQTTPDRPSAYVLTIESLGLLPDKKAIAESPSTLVVQIKNRSDVGQPYDLAIDWGDGKIVLVPSTASIPGNDHKNMIVEHVFHAAPTANGWTMKLELRRSDGERASAAYSCIIGVDRGDGSTLANTKATHGVVPITMAPDDPTSVGITLDRVEQIRSLELALEGERVGESKVTLLVAGPDGVYRVTDSAVVVATWQQNILNMQLSKAIPAKSVKLRIVASKNSSAGLRISNLSSALQIYADAQ